MPLRLFVYGSLLVPAIRRRIIGRELEVLNATLPEFARRALRNAPYPAVRAAAREKVRGQLLLGLQADDFVRLDAYEGTEYERRTVTVGLDEGTCRRLDAECYVIRPEYEVWMSEQTWNLDVFRREHAARFLREL